MERRNNNFKKNAKGQRMSKGREDRNTSQILVDRALSWAQNGAFHT